MKISTFLAIFSIICTNFEVHLTLYYISKPWATIHQQRYSGYVSFFLSFGSKFNTFIYSRGFHQLKWTNLDPLGLVRKMKDQFPDGEAIEQALLDAGISSAYQEKPCIDPSDEECPDTAPNKQSGQVGSGYYSKYTTVSL